MVNGGIAVKRVADDGHRHHVVVRTGLEEFAHAVEHVGGQKTLHLRHDGALASQRLRAGAHRLQDGGMRRQPDAHLGEKPDALIVTDDNGNTANTTKQITVLRSGDPQIFTQTLQAETLTFIEVDNDTARRGPGAPEPAANTSNSGDGLTYNSDGLWRNFTGSGYVDIGNDVGDGVAFAVTAADLRLDEALRLATANPGGIVGRRGRLEIGTPADLVTFRWAPGDPTLRVETVVHGGRTEG